MKPQAGDTVRVHYTGTLDDGSQFDSSVGREPIEFVIGGGMVIPGFDSAVSSLEVGGSTTTHIPAAEAYGERMDEAIQRVPLEMFGERVPPVGVTIGLQGPMGQEMRAVVAEVDEQTVLLDMNHPLAGKDLTFELELVEIVGK